MRAVVGGPAFLWSGLVVVLAVGLATDMWAHRRPRVMPLADAIGWSVGWVGLAGACAGAVWLLMGPSASLQFVAAYAIEWSLSADNVLAFLVVITALSVPPGYRHRVLFLGSLGAIALRLTFILAGGTLLARAVWMTYVFGALVLFAAARIALEPADGDADDTEPRTIRLLRRWLPVSSAYSGWRLTAVVAGRRMATPLLLALVVVAVTDLMLAMDSIPAIFALTRDTFIASASNALAVLGLRSLYFVLEGTISRFRFLKPALVLLLVLISAEMMVAPLLGVPVALTLAGIVVIIATAALASWVAPRRTTASGSRA
jgi:tellurite resistance protein TerC